MPSYSVDSVRTYNEQCLQHIGLTVEDAALLVDVLLEADLRGKGSHGILRLPHYVQRLQNGTTKSKPNMQFRDLTSAAAVLDADDGLGHIASVRAMDYAMDLAHKSGVAAVSVINSSHFGFAGYYTERAVQRNALGLAMTHTDTNTVPFGAKSPYLGSNALSFSAPTALAYPLTIDFCCAKISYGKVYEARAKGELLPERAALDAKGNWTRDPNQVEYLCSAAEHKGFGLALIIEVLCAMLTGIPFCRHITSMYDQMEQPPKLGHFFLAIDIARFSDVDQFKKNMNQLIGEIHALTPADDVEQVRVHGEQSYRNKQKGLSDGITLQAPVVADLVALGKPYDLQFPESL